MFLQTFQNSPSHSHRGPAHLRHPVPGRHQAEENLGRSSRRFLPRTSKESGKNTSPVFARLETIQRFAASVPQVMKYYECWMYRISIAHSTSQYALSINQNTFQTKYGKDVLNFITFLYMYLLEHFFPVSAMHSIFTMQGLILVKPWVNFINFSPHTPIVYAVYILNFYSTNSQIWQPCTLKRTRL